MRKNRIIVGAAALARKVPTPQQVASYVKAEVGPRLTGEDAQARLAVCSSCDDCKSEDDKMYCTACKCGEWRRAELHTKATMSWATCPRGRWPKRGDR